MGDCTDHGKRVVSAAHGATSLGNPTGFGVQEDVTFIEDFPATRKAPCLSVDKYRCGADVSFEDLMTPIAIGTKATLTITIQQMDEGTMSLAIVNMVKGGGGFDGRKQVFDQAHAFAYDSGNSDVTNPLTVS